jgi:hypothetical protein
LTASLPAVGGDTAPGEGAGLLWHDFASFAPRSFRELNPRTRFAINWHVEVVATKLAAVREGRSRRLIISVESRHLKSHLASVAFPAWCLGHDPSAQIFRVSYAQNLCLRRRGLGPSLRDLLPVPRSRRRIIADRAPGGDPASASRTIPPSGGDRVWRSRSTARRGNAMLAGATRKALRW